MPHSLCQLYAHIIFSTKDRFPFLDKESRDRAHAFIASVARRMGCPYVKVGGVADHIHILVDAGKDVLPVKLIADIKRESSKEFKTWGVDLSKFYWQTGYGMFSVSPTMKEKVALYIATQEKHHHKMTFQEEYLTFLKKYNVPYNEKYLWD